MVAYKSPLYTYCTMFFIPLKLTSTFTMIPPTDAGVLIHCYEYLCGLEIFEKIGKVPILLFASLELCLLMYR
jgi:hypothetical protein